MKKYLFLFIFFLLLAACESEKPVIMDHFWQLNVVREEQSGDLYEELVLHVLGTDADGSTDLEFLYLINDGEELYWTFTPDDWEMQDAQDGNEWITLNTIRTSDRSVIPRGDYRVLLIDKSGERDELEITVGTEKVDSSRLKWPELSLGEEIWQLKSPFALNVFWVYGANGTFLKQHEVLQENTPITRVLNKSSLRNSAAALDIYSYNEALGIGQIVRGVNLR